MTNRRIHINYLPKHDGLIDDFIDNHREECIICNRHLRDIILDIDIEADDERKKAISRITELILMIFREKNLKEYIWSNYIKLNDEEKNNVYLEAKFLIDKKEPFIVNTIYNKLSEFIDYNENINIEGFFRFRMKDFLIYISIISDIALEEYFIKRDKTQFINTLKYFIDSQESKSELLGIHILNNGNLKFYDENYLEINNLGNQEFISILRKKDLDLEDIIISVLLTFCPKRVEIIDSLNNKISSDIIENMKILFKENLRILIKH